MKISDMSTGQIERTIGKLKAELILRNPELAQAPAKQKTVTTELTSKHIKSHIAVAGLIFWCSVVGMIITESGSEDSYIAVTGSIVGLVYYIWAKSSQWWNHE